MYINEIYFWWNDMHIQNGFIHMLLDFPFGNSIILYIENMSLKSVVKFPLKSDGMKWDEKDDEELILFRSINACQKKEKYCRKMADQEQHNYNRHLQMNLWNISL